jgi:hypothetical protein
LKPDHKPLTVVALLAGPPGPAELWSLRRLAAAGFSLRVVQARSSRKPGTLKHLRGIIARQGVFSAISRILGSLLFGRYEDARRMKELGRLFGLGQLTSWWETSGLPIESVPYLNHQDTANVLARLQADFIVRVSGGVLTKEIFSTARIAALNIHHGIASRIRGMWSIPWGIIEGRPDWIGATVHIIDDGIDTGSVLWCGSPQLATGDTGVDLFFRAHVEAVEALIVSIQKLADGWRPVPEAYLSNPVYRSAPGVLAWIKYLAQGRGARARIILERSFRC